jgi:hypothetical protein
MTVVLSYPKNLSLTSTVFVKNCLTKHVHNDSGYVPR